MERHRLLRGLCPCQSDLLIESTDHLVLSYFLAVSGTPQGISQTIMEITSAKTTFGFRGFRGFYGFHVDSTPRNLNSSNRGFCGFCTTQSITLWILYRAINQTLDSMPPTLDALTYAYVLDMFLRPCKPSNIDSLPIRSRGRLLTSLSSSCTHQ